MNKKLPVKLIFCFTIISTMAFTIFKKENIEDKFWNWFVKNQESYYNENVDDEKREKLFDDFSNNLKKIHPDLVFEFGPTDKNGIKELTISADGIEEIFPIVESLIKKSPKIKNWKFNAFRQRVPGDDFEIEYGDLKISYSDLYFKSTNQDGKLGIELYIRNYDGKGETQNAVYILLDNLIGEYDVVTKIDWIEWEKLEEDNVKNLKPIIELRELIDK